jgi:hypothetical protein
MAIKPIQTIEGGPEYDPWATADQMERLIKSLTTSGISQNDAKQLVNLLNDVKKGGKVDQQVLRQVLGNLKTGVDLDKKEAKTQEQQDKAERGFWKTSAQNAQNATRAFKNANIADALRQTRDLGMVPIESLSDAFVKVTSIVGAFGQGIFNAANSIISSLGKIGAGVGKVLGVFGGVVAGLGGALVTGVAALLGAIDGMSDVFGTLYNSGINMAVQQDKLGSGFANLLTAARNARMTVGEFGEFIAENSRLAVAIGARAMGELSNTVRKALLPMGMYGLSMSELNEYMADYLEMSRVTGTLDAMDRAKMAKGSQEYLLMITQLAAVTGKRRDQISAELKTQSQDPDWIAFMATVPDEMKAAVGETATAMRTWFNQFGTEFGDDITRAFVNPDLFTSMNTFGKSLSFAGLDAEAAEITRLLVAVSSNKINKADLLSRLNAMKDRILDDDKSKLLRASARGIQMDEVLMAIKFTGAIEGAADEATKLQLKLDNITKAAITADELFKSLSLTWTTFMESIFTNPLFNKAMQDLSAQFSTIMKPGAPLPEALTRLATAAGGALVDGLEAISKHVGTQSFISIMAQLPDMFAALGTALGGALRYLRELFFTKKIAASGINDPIDFYQETWELKSGSEIIAGFKASFMALWTLISDPDGAVVKSLIKGFEKLGTYMVEPITNVMVGAFTAIGASLLQAAKDVWNKVLYNLSGGWLGGVDATSDSHPGQSTMPHQQTITANEDAANQLGGFEKVAIWSGGVIVGYKLMRVGWNKIVNAGSRVAPLAGGNPLAQHQADANAQSKGQSRWRRFANKIKGLPKSVRGNAIMGLFLGGIVLASEIMDLGDIDETTLDATKHREQREVAQAGGAMAGMAAGAALGSIVPVLGTAIGGIIGGLLGWWLGEKAGGALYDAILNPTAVIRDARDRATRGVHEVAGEAIIHGDSDVEENAVANYQATVRENLKLQEYQDKYDKYSKSKSPRRVKLAAEYKDKIEQLTRKLSLTTKTKEERAAIVDENVDRVVGAYITAVGDPGHRTTGGLPIDTGGDYGASFSDGPAPGGIGSKKRNTFAEFQNLGAATLESKRLLEEIKGVLDTINTTLKSQTGTIKSIGTRANRNAKDASIYVDN